MLANMGGIGTSRGVKLPVSPLCPVCVKSCWRFLWPLQTPQMGYLCPPRQRRCLSAQGQQVFHPIASPWSVLECRTAMASLNSGLTLAKRTGGKRRPGFVRIFPKGLRCRSDRHGRRNSCLPFQPQGLALAASELKVARGVSRDGAVECWLRMAGKLCWYHIT